MSKFSSNALLPVGSDTPLIYILNSAPSYKEDQAGALFTDEVGVVVKKVMEVVGIEESQIRYATVSPWVPLNDENRSRSLEKDEVDKLKEHVRRDILKTNPAAIICLGQMPAYAVLGTDESIVSRLDNMYYFRDDKTFIPTVVTWNPWTVIASESQNRLKDIERSFAQALRATQSKGRMDTNVLDFWDGDLDLLESMFPDKCSVALDYEAKNLNVYDEDFSVAGIGIGTGSKGSQVYVRVCDFWMQNFDVLKEKAPDKLKTLQNFFKGRKVYVFNVKYEQAVTLNSLGFEIESIHDVRQWCKVFCVNGGLKDIATRVLGVGAWADQTGDWANNWIKFIDGLRPTPKGALRIEYEILKNEGFVKVIEHLMNFQQSHLNDIEKWREECKQYAIDFSQWVRTHETEHTRITGLIKEWEALSEDQKKEIPCPQMPTELHPPKEPRGEPSLKKREIALVEAALFYHMYMNTQCPDLAKFDDIATKMALRYYDNNIYGQCQYTDIPIEIIAPYCVLDVKYTYDLAKKLEERAESLNITPSLDIYNRQNKLAYEMELSGICWDEQKACELSDYYYKEAVQSLKKFILSPRGREVLKISDAKALSIQATTDLEYLKSIFNPQSSHHTTSAKLHEMLATPQLKANLIFDYINTVHTKGAKDSGYPFLEAVLAEVVASEGLDDNKKPIYKRNSMERREIFDGFIKAVATPEVAQALGTLEVNHENDNFSERGLIEHFSKWRLDSTASGMIEYLYNAMTGVGGVNVDNESTWTPEFWLLYYFRLFKKVQKCRTTYIDGSIGRDLVSIVKKRDIDDRFLPRIESYHNRKTISSDELFILNTNFNANGAATKRWQAGIHTRPWETDLQDLTISRFGDEGIIMHADASQMEIRVLAAMSKDPGLLAAFASGADIHRTIAAGIWNKAPEDVTDAERRFSKMGSFSIIYGKSVNGFAREFMGGDYKRAEDLFNSFYTAYPGVRDFITAKHKEAMETGYVQTLFGDYIEVGMPEVVFTLSDADKEALRNNLFENNVRLSGDMKHKIGKALRNAQNYPIQGSASNITALSIEDLVERMKRENMKSRAFCFTHDSQDVDAKIREIVRVIELLNIAAVEVPTREYGVPMKIDFGIGCSGNEVIELKKAKITDSRILEAGFEGSLAAFTAIKDRMALNSGIVFDSEITEESTSRVEMKELFITRRAYSSSVGQDVKYVKGKLRLEIAQ